MNARFDANLPIVRLDPGDILDVDGSLWETVRQTPIETVFRSKTILDGPESVRRLDRQELLSLCTNVTGDVRIHRSGQGRLHEGVRQNLHRVLDEFDVECRDEALRRLEYVRFCDRYLHPSKKRRRGRFAANPQGYERIGVIVSRLRRHRRCAEDERLTIRNAGCETVSGSTLREWHRRWRKSGRNVTALVPLQDRKGNTLPRISDEVKDVIRKEVRDFYLTSQAPTLRMVHHKLVAEIEIANRNRPEGEKLTVPDYTTVLRLVAREVDAYDLMANRQGRKKADAYFKTVYPGDHPALPLDFVEFDHTPLDVYVCDEDGRFVQGDRRRKPVFKLWLTLARDKLTKMIFGFHLSRDPPSWTSVMRCLLMGIQVKDPTRWGARSAWPICGIPKVIVVDNGAEFHSKSFEAAAGQLGIEIRFAPRGTPQHKGLIETTFNKGMKDFIRMLPGASTGEQDDYVARRQTAMTYAEIERSLGRYIVDVLHNKPMASLYGASPLMKWDTYEVRARFPSSMTDLVAILGYRIDRTVTMKGIEYLGLVYQSPDLRGIRRREGHMGEMLMIKVDPSDLRTCLVMDEGDGIRMGRWVEVPCVNLDFTKGDPDQPLPLDLYREAVRLAKSRTARGAEVGEQVLRDAVRELMLAGKKKTPRTGLIGISATSRDWFDRNIDVVEFRVDPIDGEEDDDRGSASGVSVSADDNEKQRTRKQAKTPETVDPDPTSASIDPSGWRMASADDDPEFEGWDAK